MKKPQEEQRVLMKDNLLVQTKYELNLAENRLYNLILYKFQRQDYILKCVLTHEEAKEVIRHKGKNSIQAIGELLDSLSNKKIWVEEKKNNGKNSKWHSYNLLSGSTFDDEFNTFEIRADAFIYDLIVKKFDKGGYTPNNLNVFLTLGNYYAQRLYELLRLWSNTKTVINYEVSKLKEYLMLENSYPEYGNFKRRVITPAVKELNKKGAFEVEIKENKIGRKVHSIDFIVKDLDKRKYFNNKPAEEVPTPEILEVDTVLYDGIGTPIEVKQGCFNVGGDTAPGEEPQETAEKQGLTEVELIRKELEETIKNITLEEKINYVKLPQDTILNNEMAIKFIDYCYIESITFEDIDSRKILEETTQVFKDSKGTNSITTVVNYKYFIGIFKNKVEEFYNKNTLDSLLFG